MRVFRISFSLWWDETWKGSFDKSWKKRKYWIAKIPATSARGGYPIVFQLGPATFKILIEGRIE